jgi:beta-lactamase class A
MFRAITLASITLVLPAALGQTSTTLQSSVEQIAARHHGQVGIYALDRKSGATVELHPDEPVQTASVIKLAILYEAMEQVRSGKAHWHDKLELTSKNQVAGSGVLAFFDTPLSLTLKDTLFMMVIVSDNTATNLAIDHLGLDNINARLGLLGLKNTWLYKKVYTPADRPMPPDQKRFGLGKTTPREMATLMEKIATCDLGPAAHPSTGNAAASPDPPADAPQTDAAQADTKICAVALHMLRSQFYRDGIPRYLETVDTSETGSAIANKTGGLDAVRNDVAAIASKNGLLILSIFTSGNEDRSWTDDTEAYQTTARIAQAIVQAWSPSGLDPASFDSLPTHPAP